MHIAYSALRTNPKNHKTPLTGIELILRYKGYQNACSKYQATIADIQKYMPGWVPPFELKAQS